MTMSDRVVVIGAGMAGLTAARVLTPAARVVVVDKGRGVGGRLATRRIGEATFDHGAQFITTHTEEFADAVQGWRRAGSIRPWFTGQVGPDGVPPSTRDGHVRYRGAPSMNAIAKQLATGLDVRTGLRAAAVRPSADGWVVETADGDMVTDAVLLTAPMPQTLDLLAAGAVQLPDAVADILAGVRYDPCVAVLAPLRAPHPLPHPGAVAPADGPIDWLADNRAKGVSEVPAVTLHADAAFSHDAWGAGDTEIADRLLEAAGLAAVAVRDAVQVHRWRYARPSVPLTQRCQVVAHPGGHGGPLVIAGDAFAGSKVEGAHLSGLAAARALGAP